MAGNPQNSKQKMSALHCGHENNGQGTQICLILHEEVFISSTKKKIVLM